MDIEVPGKPESLFHQPNLRHAEGEYRFELKMDDGRVRARESTDLTLLIRNENGQDVQLGEIMGSFAHLVAFDEKRSGFAHLHPQETDLENRPDPQSPELHFNITIPEPGLFVIWAQIVLNGEEVFIPFWFEVEP